MSATPQIVKSEDFSSKSVSYSDPKKLGHGGQAIYVNYQGKPLIIQTPKMYMPWGMGKYDSGDGNVKYSLDMSFKNMENNANMESFYKAIESFDEKLVDDAVNNSMSWFKKKKQSKEVCKALYAPMIKVSRDKDGEPNGKFPPTFKCKVPFRDGVFHCDAYDQNRNLVEDDLSTVLVKGGYCQALIQCVGIWFAGGKFGCSWKIVQMKVTPPAGIHGYSFIDDSDDGGEEGEDGSDEELMDDDELVDDDED